jgi:hypothetical protein
MSLQCSGLDNINNNMKFQDLVGYILLEKEGKDPMKFVGTGPMGFRKSTGVDNPEKFVNTRKDPKDKGIYIPAENRRLIGIALGVAMSSTKAGMQLKSLVREIGQLDFEFKNAKQEALAIEKQLARTKPGSESEFVLKERMDEYEAIAKNAKQKLQKLEPFFIKKIHDVIKEGSTEFVKEIQSKPNTKIKSLDEIDQLVIDSEDEVKVKEFLKDIFKGKTEFEPLEKFVAAEKGEGKNPLFDLITIYKTVSNTMVSKNLIGNAEKIFNYVTGRAQKVRSIIEPTKGRVEMKKKDPSLMKVIALIKNKKYDEAKNAVNDSKLDNAKKVELMNNIEKLKSGDLTEADVIRPLYAA